MAQPKQLIAFRCERSAVEQLAQLAREGDRTLSAEIRRAIREHVKDFSAMASSSHTPAGVAAPAGVDAAEVEP